MTWNGFWSRLELTQGHATHAEQVPQLLATAFGVMELLFCRMGIRGHALTLRIREGMLFQACQGEGRYAGAQGTGDVLGSP